MRLIIGSRQSDLARIQAYQVGDLLKKTHPQLEIEYLFKTSLGDRNLTDPLWKLPEKGVFTEDFLKDLKENRCDLVVHSWKDLPTEEREDTEIVATLPRADMRDLLLVHRKRWESVLKTKKLKIYSSSPRRAYNLEPFLKEYLPGSIQNITFESVRGNVPTRIRKLIESSDVTGLIVAKAALDRLLRASREEFSQTQSEILKHLSVLNFCVLPLRTNPTAAAQGALAIEVKKGREDIKNLFKDIHCKSSFEEVEIERKILKSYGGGCHQKIGVSCIRHPLGKVLSLRGKTDQGEVLNKFEFDFYSALSQIPRATAWPLNIKDVKFYKREPIDIHHDELASKDLFVSKSDAWPDGYTTKANQLVWTAGLSTWKKLAEKNIWVHGTSESLGETSEDLSHFLGRSMNWVKLTHLDAGQFSSSKTPILATYKLVKSHNTFPDLNNKTHFFWSSGSAFSLALELYPQIADRNHACGPGHSYGAISKLLNGRGTLSVYIDHEDWLNSLEGE